VLVASAALALATLIVAMCHTPAPPPDPEAEAHYRIAAAQATGAARDFLAWLETATERMAPDRFAALVDEARRLHNGPMDAARAQLAAHPPPTEMQSLAASVHDGFAHADASFQHITAIDGGPFMEVIGELLTAWHHAARAQEIFFAARTQLPAFAGFWLLPGATELNLPAQDQPADSAAQTGILHLDPAGHHGGFSVFVPETYTADHAWPVIVALHGASGNGRDFLWTWVREANSLGYLLVAPTSVDNTWSEVEDLGLLEIIAWLSQRYRVDNHRILLTGLSDGGTFTLIYGLAHPDVYRALAPLCGVLHPANAPLGNLGRARGVPIYLVHGAQDFLFPVAYARLTRDTLLSAGAALEYRELPELSHTYPRSENVRILRWFDALAQDR